MPFTLFINLFIRLYSLRLKFCMTLGPTTCLKFWKCAGSGKQSMIAPRQSQTCSRLINARMLIWVYIVSWDTLSHWGILTCIVIPMKLWLLWEVSNSESTHYLCVFVCSLSTIRCVCVCVCVLVYTCVHAFMHVVLCRGKHSFLLQK